MIEERVSSHFTADARWINLLLGEAHVWAVGLSNPHEAAEKVWKTLSFDETERAIKFCSPSDTDRFVAARGLLRYLLSRYTSLSPSAIRFQYGMNGKPTLGFGSEILPPHKLYFNVAHCIHFALYAFALDSDVGIDVECIRPLPDMEQIAARFFSDGECLDLARTGPQGKGLAFFSAWTRKEAFLKGLGSGLSLPLANFRVSLLPGQGAMFLETSGVISGIADHQCWLLHDLALSPDHAAAIAHTGLARPVRVFRFPDPIAGLDCLGAQTGLPGSNFADE